MFAGAQVVDAIIGTGAEVVPRLVATNGEAIGAPGYWIGEVEFREERMFADIL